MLDTTWYKHNRSDLPKNYLHRLERERATHDVDMLKYSERKHMIQIDLKVIGCEFTLWFTKFTYQIISELILRVAVEANGNNNLSSFEILANRFMNTELFDHS